MRWIRWGVSLITLLSAFGLVTLFSNRVEGAWVVPGRYFLALGLAGFAFWLSGTWIAVTQAQAGLMQRVEKSESHLQEIQKRMTAVLQLNAHLADAVDETSLMEAVLGLFGDLVNSTGSAYIPMDNLGQPLALLRHGHIPEADLRELSRQALSPEGQARCKTCALRHATLTEDCPLRFPKTFGQTEIYCFPLARGEHNLGMIYLYLPAEQPLPSELGLFLESLLSEIVLAIDTLRMRNQETATLRQLQLVRSPEKDLEADLKEFLDNAQQALEADYAMLWLRGGSPPRPMVIFGQDKSDYLDDLYIDSMIQQAIQCNGLVSACAGQDGIELPAGLGSILAAPLTAPDSPPLGAMLIANRSREPFFPRQQKVLKTLASQAAVLVENQRFILEMEYHIVMEERNRLAREIHDGLAQTLAFLKLQASQMQAYLSRGETSRLQEAMDMTYKTLTDAYLDTRQAIDHLRVTPRDSMRTWLTQAAEDFTEATRINASLSITIDPVGLPMEIQAQLLRVVQEALSNIRKHAQAQHVSVALFRWEADMIIEISDDGQGFSPDDVPTISQYGLRGMRERAELIGADFQIISSPTHGTTVRLRLPYRLEETPV